jgi:hypothetical protein
MVERSRKKYNFLKWIGGIIVFTVIVAFLASWYISVKIRPIITSEIKSLVLKATDSLYHVEFSDIKTNLITGNASMLNVKIIPDTNILKKLINLKKAPNNIYTIKLNKVSIRGFHPDVLYRAHKLHVDLILFEKPEVIMANKQLVFNENKPPRPGRPPYQYIARYLKELRVKTIAFRDIKFKYFNNNLPIPEVNSVENLNVTLTDWLIDPTSAEDRSRMYLLKDISVRLNDYSFATPDSLYDIKVNQMDFRAATGRLKIREFALVPRYEEMKFSELAGTEKQRYNIKMSNISMSGINFPLYVLKQELLAKEMNIDNGFVAVFSNNMNQKPKINKVGKDPHQLFQALKGLITVEKLNLANVNISYSEFDRDSKQKGVINFDNTSGSITNVTNSPKYKFKDHVMIADLTTSMMGSSTLHVYFRFDLQSKAGDFAYNGSLTGLNGRTLNKITRPLGMLQIRSGFVNKLDFSIKANNKIATGVLNFAYQRLNVGLLKKEEGKENLVKMGWASFLANQLVINSDNPDRKGNFVSATINYKREPSATFFSFIWRTLFQGIKNSVGLTDAKEAQINSRVAQFEQIKIDRDARRARRERRRNR